MNAATHSGLGFKEVKIAMKKTALKISSAQPYLAAIIELSPLRYIKSPRETVIIDCSGPGAKELIQKNFPSVARIFFDKLGRKVHLVVSDGNNGINRNGK